MVSYGMEVFKVHPRRWSAEMMADYLSFQAYDQVKAEEQKARPGASASPD